MAVMEAWVAFTFLTNSPFPAMIPGNEGFARGPDLLLIMTPHLLHIYFLLLFYRNQPPHIPRPLPETSRRDVSRPYRPYDEHRSA